MASTENTSAVYGATDRTVVSARYPLDRRKLLEAIQAKRGDRHLSDTVAVALDEFVDRHFPKAA